MFVASIPTVLRWWLVRYGAGLARSRNLRERVDEESVTLTIENVSRVQGSSGFRIPRLPVPVPVSFIPRPLRLQDSELTVGLWLGLSGPGGKCHAVTRIAISGRLPRSERPEGFLSLFPSVGF